MACISRERDIEVVAELDRREPVLPTVASLRPDVAVIDDDIACHDGFAVIEALHTITPSCHALIMASRPCNSATCARRLPPTRRASC